MALRSALTDVAIAAELSAWRFLLYRLTLRGVQRLSKTPLLLTTQDIENCVENIICSSKKMPLHLLGFCRHRKRCPVPVA